MPLAEFLRISKGKMDSTQQRTHDPSFRPETDFMELVWENGQIMMQGQSRKGPISDNFHTLASKPHDTRYANGSKTAKFSMVDSISADFQLPVPSYEMGLDHDDVDIVPWLNYPPIEDPLPNEYNTSDFLRELSGVTMNDLSTENHLASREKRSSFQGNGYSSGIDNSVSLKHGNTSKAPSSTEKHISSLSNITRNNNGSSNQNNSRDSIHNPSSLCAFTSLRLQKLDAEQPSNTNTSSGFTNFPCISRHLALARANHVNLKGTNRSENDDQRLALRSKDMVSRNDQSVVAPMLNGNSESFPAKPTEEILSSIDKLREDVATKDASQNPADCATVGKPEMGGERNKEQPVVVAASSVCSGNSVERAANELKRDLKRKSRDTGESEDPSEEVEEESVGARKASRARAGLKRTRAAEVHNLSERRRRDRINEKMRALQELIPNCNKVDKASMLDEAIEYLKTLQLQVQMWSMGGGLYMPPMMLPAIQGAHMPHFSPMGVGMGLGFNMLDMNSSMKMMPFQSPHYPISNTGPAFHGMPGSSFQAFGHSGQGLPMPMQRPPVFAASGVPSSNIPNVLGVAGSTNAAPLVPSICSKDIGEIVHGNNVESSMNQASNQLSKESTGNPPASHVEAQAAKAKASSEAMPS